MDVLKRIPHRPFVFSIPKILRRYFLYDRKLLAELSRCAWESLKVFIQHSVPETDPILGAVIMDSDRVEKKAAMKIALADTDAEIEPVPTEAGGRKSEPELDRLSNILKTFNEHFNTTFADSNRIFKHIRDDIAPKVAADAAFQNAKADTPPTARLAHDQALGKATHGSVKDFTQFYKQFVENESFKRFVGDMVYAMTSQ